MARISCLPTTLLIATPAMIAGPAMAMNGIGHGSGGIGVGSGAGGLSAPGKIVLGTIQAMLTGDSRFLREAVLARAGSAEPAAPGAWGQGYAGGGRADGSGTSGAVSSRLAGGVMGADAMSGDWRLGLVGGYRTDRINDPADAASASVSAYQAGGYASGRWGGVRLSAGAAYEWSHIDARRSDSTGAYAGRYGADLGQIFAEAGYRLRTGPVGWEPYLGAAWTSLERAGFTEAGGGPNPLSLSGGRRSVAFVDVGARARMEWQVAGLTLQPYGGLTWRQAYGQLSPALAASQAGTAIYFEGDPIDRDAARIDAGLDMNLPRGARFNLGYDGQIARRSRTDAVLARLSLRF